MINQLLLNMLIRQVRAGAINTKDIKDEQYRIEAQKILDEQ